MPCDSALCWEPRILERGGWSARTGPTLPLPTRPCSTRTSPPKQPLPGSNMPSHWRRPSPISEPPVNSLPNPEPLPPVRCSIQSAVTHMILTREEIAFLDVYCHEGTEPPFGGP